jgi:hypothetical protein
MAKKIQPQSPAEAKPAATATCPQAQDTSASPEPASVVCATNIACETQAPFCPQKESQLKPHTIGHTGWHTCLAHTQDMPGCTTVTSTPEAAGAAPQTIGTWFQGCGIPPVTLTCPQQATPQAGTIGVTGWYTCHQGTAATVCTQVGCTPPTHLLGCTTATTPPAAAQTIGTWFHGCGIPPVTLTCPQQAIPQAGTIGVTGWYTCHPGNTAATVCTQVGCTPPTHLLGCTTVTANPHTNPAICGTGPQAAEQVGPTGWYTCHQQGGTAATVCTQVGCTPPTHLMGCTTVTANPVTNPAICGTGPQAAAQVGPTGWYTCHQQGGTAATVCTQVGCTPPTHLLGCTTVTANPVTNPAICGTGPQAAAQVGPTGWYTCHQQGSTAATVCTQIGCSDAMATPSPTTTVVGPTGWYTCHQQGSTAATVCTQVGCAPQTHLLGCTTVTSNPHTSPANCGTMATVCTQVGCAPTHLLGCTTATTPPQAAAASPAPVGPTGWYTCGQVPTCGNETKVFATLITQPFTHCACPAPTNFPGCTTVTANPHTSPANCGTMATVCTQVGCAPTHLLGCTTATTPPPAAGTIGVTGWYTCGHAPTCGQNTRIVATTYTQIGC